MVLGLNSNGQLGDNTTISALTPVQTLGSGGTGTLSLGLWLYNSSGVFTSQIKDIGTKVLSWGNIKWSTIQPTANTSIQFRARSCDDAACSSIGAIDESIDKILSSCPVITTVNSINAIDNITGVALTSNGNSCVSFGDQYIQYQATLLASSDQTQTPILSDVTIGYNSYPNSQALLSSPTTPMMLLPPWITSPGAKLSLPEPTSASRSVPLRVLLPLPPGLRDPAGAAPLLAGIPLQIPAMPIHIMTPLLRDKLSIPYM